MTFGLLLSLSTCARAKVPTAQDGSVADVPVSADLPVAEGSTVDTAPPFPARCHHDCFRTDTVCQDGHVRAYTLTAVPCEVWTGICPPVAGYDCTAGCALATPDGGVTAPYLGNSPAILAIHCAETPSKHSGDPCRTPSHCLPNRATETADGGLATEFLTCAGSVCVPGPSIAPADYYSPCDDTAAPGSGNGVTRAEGCSCLRHEDPSAGCVRTACTRRCDGDHECPQGSFCDASIRILDAPGQPYVPFCRPGPRQGVPQGFSCSGQGSRDR